MHTASPYSLSVDDPQRDLVEPAVSGTLNVLGACQRSGTVRRVVLTSSMAAITDEPERDRVLTESDWNTKLSLDRTPTTTRRPRLNAPPGRSSSSRSRRSIWWSSIRSW